MENLPKMLSGSMLDNLISVMMQLTSRGIIEHKNVPGFMAKLIQNFREYFPYFSSDGTSFSYLARPMTGVDFSVRQPFQDTIDLLVANSFPVFDPIATMAPIVRESNAGRLNDEELIWLDAVLIALSRCLIWDCTGPISDGASSEALLAKILGKPVYVITLKGKTHSSWTRGKMTDWFYAGDHRIILALNGDVVPVDVAKMAVGGTKH